MTKSLPPTPDPFVRPLADDRYLVGLLAQVTGDPTEVVLRRLIENHEHLGEGVVEELRRWGIPPFKWSDRLVEFYDQTDVFLYESLTWNRTLQKNDMRRWIAGYLARDFGRPARILIFGDGLGFDALYFSLAGHEVSYFEVSRRCKSFAQAIFELNGVTVRMLTAPEEIERGGFDAVVCMDVLEHLPDPPATVVQFAAGLRPGGRLIVHAPFYYIPELMVTHLWANRIYSGDLARLYSPVGLRLIGGRLLWNPIVLEKQPTVSRWSPSAIASKVVLHCSGLLLAVARFLAMPHVWATSAMMIPESRRLRAMAGRLRSLDGTVSPGDSEIQAAGRA